MTSPLSPAEIGQVLYSRIFPVCPQEAVLQQEIVLALGSRILVTQPELLDGILFIRVGWIVEAIRIKLRAETDGQTTDIFALSPSEIKTLLEEVLSVKFKDEFLWRQIQGALNKVPSDFYHHAWLLLERSPCGFKVGGNVLLPHPTLSDMDATDGGFQLLIERQLKHIRRPEKRFMLVETFVIIATVLKRNPELSFAACADIDQILEVFRP